MATIHKRLKRLVNDSGVPGALMRPEYNMGAAARVAYETFVREAGVDKDARVGTWDQLKTFHKARWRTVAQAVIDAATGVQRKVGLTSAPDVRGSTKEKGRPHGGRHEQNISVRGRQLAKRRTSRRTSKSSAQSGS